MREPVLGCLIILLVDLLAAAVVLALLGFLLLFDLIPGPL